MGNRFTIGKQPCADFKAQRDGNEYGEWDNRHECFGSKGCTKRVSFCVNCHTDHHEDGWAECWERRKQEESTHAQH